MEKDRGLMNGNISNKICKLSWDVACGKSSKVSRIVRRGRFAYEYSSSNPVGWVNSNSFSFSSSFLQFNSSSSKVRGRGIARTSHSCLASVFSDIGRCRNSGTGNSVWMRKKVL